MEQILQNMPVDSHSQGIDENARFVDDAVFLNMIQRLEALEKNQQVVKQDLLTITKSNATPVLDHSESVEKLQIEIATIKNSLLQLQTFTMQTNQRLSETVLKQNNTADIECIPQPASLNVAPSLETTDVESEKSSDGEETISF